MNNVDVLFVISAILVPLMLISLNFSAISDFYEYSVPMNSLVLEPSFSYEEDRFEKTKQEKDSQCFTTLKNNLFCYAKPRFHSKSMMISYVIGTSGINGELHFDPIDMGIRYFTMKNMTIISGDTALVTFADNDYRVGNEKRVDYQITDNFEFSTVIEKFDTFIAKCNNYEGTGVTVVQYLGVERIDNIDYFLTWHLPAHSENGIPCKYPQIIQHSLNHNFREL